MFELVVIACLADACREFANDTPFRSQTQCVALAQILVAGWAGENPQYRIKGILCRPIAAKGVET